MKRVLVCLFFYISIISCTAQDSLIGEWHGIIDGGFTRFVVNPDFTYELKTYEEQEVIYSTYGTISILEKSANLTIISITEIPDDHEWTVRTMIEGNNLFMDADQDNQISFSRYTAPVKNDNSKK